MGLDITPRVPEGRQIVQAYGDGAFKITGVDHQGSVLVLDKETLPWSGEATMEALAPILAAEPEILIFGCGPTFSLPDAELRDALHARGIVLEWMDTGAACRTFNVLAIEDRSVAAALIAVT